MRCCVLIPVYNHPDTVCGLTERLRASGLPIILVNDGSDHRCSEALQRLAEQHADITLIERPGNGGKGAAVKSGLRAAARAGYTHALQIDADGQHNTSDVPELVSLAQQYPAAVIAGIPQFENVPRLRYYGRYLTHWWVWINTLSFDISDAMCGFRIYPIDATLAITEHTHTGDRMDFDPEILVRLHWAGTAVIEHPTAVHYPEDGVSHFHGCRDNALISWMHTRLFFGMLLRLPRLAFRSNTPRREVHHD